MSCSIYFKKLLWISLILIIALLYCWTISMRRIDLYAWAIGPGKTGQRVVQISQSSGSINLFIGEDGFSSYKRAYHLRRIFDTKDSSMTWFPKFGDIKITTSSVNICIAYWGILLVYLVINTIWIIRINNAYIKRSVWKSNHQGTDKLSSPSDNNPLEDERE